VYLCDFNKNDLDAITVLRKVHQVAPITAFGDVLCVMEDYKEIKRISDGNMVTTFVYTTQSNESFRAVGSGGRQAYACASQVQYLSISKCNHLTINLFNDFGVVLKTFGFGTLINYLSNLNLMKISDENNCILTTSSAVHFLDLQQRKVKTYEGSIGTNPRYRFRTTGMTTDNQNNILLAVSNDNAIHLLDKSLTFQKLLMTAEDGLHRPSSVALDRDGYLWVGCEDGQIHIVNYHYLLTTDRQTRLKLKQCAS
jgi:hypothetical protein